MASSFVILLDEASARINYVVALVKPSDLPAWFATKPIAPYDKCQEPVEIKGYQGASTYASRQVFEWRNPDNGKGLANGADLQAGFKQLCAQVQELHIDRVVITSNFRHHVAYIVPMALSLEGAQYLLVDQLTPAPA